MRDSLLLKQENPYLVSVSLTKEGLVLGVTGKEIIHDNLAPFSVMAKPNTVAPIFIDLWIDKQFSDVVLALMGKSTQSG